MQTRFSRLVGALLLALSLALALIVVPAPQASAASNNQTGYNFFVSKGLTGYQSAGIIGNLIQESGDPINPRAKQVGGKGRGIAQWSEGERWSSLITYAKQRGQDRYSLDLQLNFIWRELNQSPSFYGLYDLKNSRSVPAATKVFMSKYERCGKCAVTNRTRYAESVYAKYGGGTQPPTTETSLPTLRKGSKGSAVRTLQYVLSPKYTGKIDGVFGAGTEKAVRSYQASKGLKADGLVGGKTWGKLLPTVKKGSQGNAVRALQRELQDEGYKLTVDGKFGPGTESAVKSYQKKQKLSADGIVGIKTWGSLID